MDTSFGQTAVVVINQNGKEHLQDCFLSLQQYTPDETELVLLDNGSTDDSVPFVREHFPKIRIVAYETNQGFSGGYDKVIRDGTWENVVLLNNDTKVTKGWLEELLKPLEDPDVVITGARLLSFDGKFIDHAGGKVTVAGGGIDIDKGNPISDVTTASTGPTGFACGGGMLVRRKAFLELGGFDPNYVIYHEDVDLGWKAWLAGYKVVHVPDSVILHKGGASMGEHEAPHRAHLAQRNRLANLFANAGMWLLLKGLFVSCLFDVYRIGKWTLTGKWSTSAAVFRANVSLLRQAKHLWKQRRFVQGTLRKRTDGALYELGVLAGLLESFRAYQRR